MSLSRRGFFALAAATSLRAASRSSKVEIGMDSYTLRGFGWDAFQYLDYAKKVGLDVIQFSEWPNLGSYDQVRDDSYLKRVREHADKLGVRIEAGTWGVCPTNPGFGRSFAKYGTPAEQLRFALHWGGILGAKSIRCVMGSGNLRREDGPIEKHVEAMLKVLAEVRDDALRAGIKIAPENHKDLRATEMRALIEEAGTDFVGCTLDTGNPMEVLEDPLETVEVLGPVAVASHFRDSVLWEHPRGAAFQWTALGDGTVGMEGAVKRFIEVAPGTPIMLEIITGRPPAVLPYWENDFWRAFPNLKAEEFLRFAKLVRKGGPLMAGMVIPNNAKDNPFYEKAVVEQQRVDFERSLAWLRGVL
ncbi:MAG: sugar phosphate isomerase/epimerase [Acidobacteria bacterium]|nr:sugar phosphate isomerase/epimerase [Acidobacteriota bacterium]